MLPLKGISKAFGGARPRRPQRPIGRIPPAPTGTCKSKDARGEARVVAGVHLVIGVDAAAVDSAVAKVTKTRSNIQNH